MKWNKSSSYKCNKVWFLLLNSGPLCHKNTKLLRISYVIQLCYCPGYSLAAVVVDTRLLSLRFGTPNKLSTGVNCFYLFELLTAATLGHKASFTTTIIRNCFFFEKVTQRDVSHWSALELAERVVVLNRLATKKYYPARNFHHKLWFLSENFQWASHLLFIKSGTPFEIARGLTQIII